MEPDEEIIRTVVGKHPVIIYVRYKPFTDEVKQRLVDLVMPMMDDILLEMKKSEEGEIVKTCADQPNLSNSNEEAAPAPPKKKRNRKESAKKE